MNKIVVLPKQKEEDELLRSFHPRSHQTTVQITVVLEVQAKFIELTKMRIDTIHKKFKVTKNKL